MRVRTISLDLDLNEWRTLYTILTLGQPVPYIKDSEVKSIRDKMIEIQKRLDFAAEKEPWR